MQGRIEIQQRTGVEPERLLRSFGTVILFVAVGLGTGVAAAMPRPLQAGLVVYLALYLMSEVKFPMVSRLTAGPDGVSLEGRRFPGKHFQASRRPEVIALRIKWVYWRGKRSSSQAPITVIVADGEEGPLDLAQTHHRDLAVETARRIARACGAGYRDETVDSPETVSVDELRAQSTEDKVAKSGHFYEGTFSQFQPVPETLRSEVTVGSDSVEFSLAVGNPMSLVAGLGGASVGVLVPIIQGTNTFGLVLGLVLGTVAGCIVALAFPTLYKRMIIQRDGLSFWDPGQEKPTFIPWDEIDDLVFNRTLVEAVVRDRPVILRGGVGPDQKDWMKKLFETVSGKSSSAKSAQPGEPGPHQPT